MSFHTASATSGNSDVRFGFIEATRKQTLGISPDQLIADTVSGQLLSFMVTGLNDCLVLLGALSIKAINPQAPERNHLCRMKNTMNENRQRNRVSFTHSVGTRIDSWVASNALLAKLPLPASAWLLLSRPGALFRPPTRH